MRDSTSEDLTNRKVVAVIQARMRSSRLPGKVLARLGESTLLEQLLDRLQPCRSAEIVVATSTLGTDDDIAAVARRRGLRCIRGPEDDVLDRFETAAQHTGADFVVRLTADNPLVNGTFVDECVSAFLDSWPAVSYLDTMTSGTFPYGLSVEVLDRSALYAAWREGREPEDREHVTRFVHRRPNRFPAHHLRSGRDWSSLRWTVDTEADLEMMQALFAAVGPRINRIGWEELAEFCAARADITNTNRP